MAGREFLSIAQAAERLGLDVSEVKRLVESGEVTGRRDAGTIEIDPASIDSILATPLSEDQEDSDVMLSPSGINSPNSDIALSDSTSDSDFRLECDSDIAFEADCSIPLDSDSGFSLELIPPEDSCEFSDFDAGDSGSLLFDDDESDAFAEEFSMSTNDNDFDLGGEFEEKLDDLDVFDPDDSTDDSDLFPSKLQDDSYPLSKKRARSGAGVFVFAVLTNLGILGGLAYLFHEHVYRPDVSALSAALKNVQGELVEANRLIARQQTALASMARNAEQWNQYVAETAKQVNKNSDDLDQAQTSFSTKLAALKIENEHSHSQHKTSLSILRGDLEDVIQDAKSTKLQLVTVKLSATDAVMQAETIRFAVDKSLAAQREHLLNETKELDDLYQKRLEQLMFAEAEPSAPTRSSTSGSNSSGSVSVEEMIRKEMSRKSSFQFVDVPLTEFASWLSDLHKIPIRIDEKALEDEGIATDQPINIVQDPIHLGAGLNQVLRPHNLDWIIRDDTLLITSKSEADSYHTTHVYDVSDLLGTPGQPFEDDRDLRYHYDALTSLLHTSIDTDWDVTESGKSTIHTFDGTLTVQSNRHVHHQIEQLLSNLRKTREARKANFEKKAAVAAESNNQRDDQYVVVSYAVMPASELLAMSKPSNFGLGFGFGGVVPKEAQGKPSPTTAPDDTESHRRDELAKRLAELIPKLVEPSRWDEGGAAVEAIPGAILVRNIPAIQAKVRRLLKPFIVSLPDEPIGEGTTSQQQYPGYGNGLGGMGLGTGFN